MQFNFIRIKKALCTANCCTQGAIFDTVALPPAFISHLIPYGNDSDGLYICLAITRMLCSPPAPKLPSSAQLLGHLSAGERPSLQDDTDYSSSSSHLTYLIIEKITGLVKGNSHGSRSHNLGYFKTYHKECTKLFHCCAQV